MHISLRGQTYAGCRCFAISASAFIGARRMFKAYALAVRGLAMFKASAFIRRLSTNEPSPRHVSHFAEGCGSSLATCMFGSWLGNTCPTKINKKTSSHPESNHGPSDFCCRDLQSDALQTEL